MSLHTNGEKAFKLLGMSPADIPIPATPDSGIPPKAQLLLGLSDDSCGSSESPTLSKKAMSVLGIEDTTKSSIDRRPASKGNNGLSIRLPSKESLGFDIASPQTSSPGTPFEKGRRSSERGKRVLKMELEYEDDLSRERAKQRMKTLFGDDLKIVERPSVFCRSRSNPLLH